MDSTFRDEEALNSSSAAPHPEEMRASIKVRIGTWFSLRASARATPAGLASVAVLAAAILVPIVLLAKGRRRA